MGKQIIASSLVTAALLTLAGPASAAWYDCRVIDNQATDAWNNTLVDLPVEADSLADAERRTRAFVAQDADNPTDISLDCRVNEEE
ncbi:hypothetical protein SOM59_07760 [Pseudomonas coleopterorum]|jgi:hypothetical protein|uniref:hypothetical protein n=1 Tax=Pseudomonas TaxID=286 RepID=UPI000F05CA22|nr:hypothetical protein [Pseudomonas coleopterorum]MBD8481100.1 hypothetical protein [Pseudomonas coleopterorum]MDY1016982.1 hypothetical protein [Pseudomonas coleopterorum]